MPIVLPAPVRFSMNTCWRSSRDRCSPTTRATKSRPPPAASGTMKRTGRFGHVASSGGVPCAWAVLPSSSPWNEGIKVPASAAFAPLTMSRRREMPLIHPPLLFSFYFFLDFENSIARRTTEIVLFRRQRDELDLVAGHLLEMTRGPFRLGLFDTLLPRRHEIPPDMARAIHRRAAKDGEMCVGQRADGDLVTGLEHQQAVAPELVAGNVDLAIEHVDRAFFEVGVERQARSGFEMHVAKQRFRCGLDRRARPVGRAD